ncbi:transcriptional regulator, LacI family [Burkholderia sp. D7]|nr:transcriptional regulator, LacI family [Burkholderia sp. D7]
MKSTMPDDDKFPTSAPPRMADVARIAGVSKMTVSRVLAGRPVSVATRERVLDVVNQLGYVADAAAGALSSGRSSFVAVLVPSLSSSNFSDTVRGINDVIEPAGMQMLLANTDYDLPREEELVRALLRYQPRCIVLTGSHHTAETHSLLERARIPVIETWDMPAHPIDRVVGFSNAEASRAMVRHLYERGYERIAFVSSASKLDRRGIDRRRGYLKEVRAAGCEPRDITKSAWTTTMAHGVAMAHGAAALQQLLERWPDTDAVMCASDIHAFGAVMACHRLGLSVPGDIAVAGFGDFEVSRHCYPTITTVSVDAYGIGRATGESLLSALDEAEGEGKPDKTRGTKTVAATKRKPLPTVIQIHYEVVPREST